MAVSESKLVEQAAEDLYGLPPGEFTRARDARVKELRKEDRDAADAIKGLRKPTVAAWALNQLARRRPKDLARLLKAGEELRAAQEELLAGGDRGAFQEAAAKTDERHARRELEAAVKALRHAEERAEAAKAHAAEAAERARTTADRLKDAKRAEAAARKAHTRAERALESAERKP